METLFDATKDDATEEREEVNAIRAGIIAKLNERLVAAGESPVLAPVYDQADEQSALKYARRVTVPADVPLNAKALVDVYDLYTAEAKAIAKFEGTVSRLQITEEDDAGSKKLRHLTAEEQAGLVHSMKTYLQEYELVRPQYQSLANPLQHER